jgi:Domain of unknown function (DUF4169)
MPAVILSFSKARKSKARSAKEKQSEQNRILFGRTKAEKQIENADKNRAASLLDGTKRVIKIKPVMVNPQENGLD